MSQCEFPSIVAFPTSDLSLGRAAMLKSYEQLQDVSSDVQVEQIRLIQLTWNLKMNVRR